jgi:DNA repair exonuclease SbcCD nuclease subunit
MPEISNDEVLEYVIQKVEETKIGPSVTLAIGGLVVVGGLVSSKLYYDYLSSLFDIYTDKSEGETIERKAIYDTKDPIELEALEKYSKDWKESMIKLRDRKDGDNDRPTLIHLHNVEVWEVFSTEPFRFEYWRGKLSSIDGFSLGTKDQLETRTLSGSSKPPETT